MSLSLPRSVAKSGDHEAHDAAGDGDRKLARTDHLKPAIPSDRDHRCLSSNRTRDRNIILRE